MSDFPSSVPSRFSTQSDSLIVREEEDDWTTAGSTQEVSTARKPLFSSRRVRHVDTLKNSPDPPFSVVVLILATEVI